ncbi:MAG: DNA-3-methyladenine glycosylase [Proteobacteria bacterium]|nr:DNA-3-methyladenine glycosylase [Pseudomonadota bacterium]
MKTIRIKQPDNFSFDACLDFLDRGYDECLYSVDKGSVTRLIRLTTGLVLINVSADESGLVIQYDNQKINQDEIKHCVSDWFDLGRDISGFYTLLEFHPQTKSFPKDYCGLRLMGIVSLFEALCWCVMGQQINLTFAHKMKTRLVHKYGDTKVENGVTHYCFPTPEILLNADREELVAMQFSKQKINYIYNISQAFCSGELNREELLQLNKQEQMDKLLAIKGIGPWTANYVSMKSLRDMTCIAYGDTGLSSALHAHFNTEKKPDKATIDRIFKPFAGWESYLNFYLWKSLSD